MTSPTALDVAYLVSQGLTTENRTGQDQRLVRHSPMSYSDALELITS